MRTHSNCTVVKCRDQNLEACLTSPEKSGSPNNGALKWEMWQVLFYMKVCVWEWVCMTMRVRDWLIERERERGEWEWGGESCLALVFECVVDDIWSIVQTYHGTCRVCCHHWYYHPHIVYKTFHTNIFRTLRFMYSIFFQRTRSFSHRATLQQLTFNFCKDCFFVF